MTAAFGTHALDPERLRLKEQAQGLRDWQLWGPYLSDRQWGTVREDYSADGEAWNHLTYEQACSRAYRWGEDGLAGFCDSTQRLCLGLGLWNGVDPILKERLFGLSGPEGSHGEDVKELYWHLDAVPTHSYLRMLYKYPQREFPYDQLRAANRGRPRSEGEFELLDTGILDENRYFDVFVEYAKADEADILMRITAVNRGPEPARLHMLPQMWFANHWSWRDGHPKPSMALDGPRCVAADHRMLGRHTFHVEVDAELLFCENESNPNTFGLSPGNGVFKDGLHERIVHERRGAIRFNGPATKVGAWHIRTLAPGESWVVRTRLVRGQPILPPFTGFDSLVDLRRAEADRFYEVIQRGLEDADARSVQRQAFAGMIWNKQFYKFDVYRWLRGDPTMPPPPPQRKQGRNADWRHLSAEDIISMPDKWEYPWFAAWDLAFHCVPLALIDPAFAKHQLLLLTSEDYMHPNGQIPAYEWAFGDVNPPVHAWAAWRVFEIERQANGGRGDRVFLERIFHKLMLNFAWWVNRKDAQGRNVFQGGFLGLDNIGVFDRSRPLPTGGFLDQADGTAWMAMFALKMMRIALELALEDDVFEDIASKFFEHFLYIAQALNNIGERGIGLWSESDKFFHDVLNLPDGTMHELKLRSMVGLTPLFAVETIEPDLLRRLPRFARRLDLFLNRRTDLASLVSRWDEPGVGERRLLSLLRGHRVKRLLVRMLDPEEFLSDHGIRSMSRAHAKEPYVFETEHQRISVGYEPGESQTYMFGGNSNWRGPVWFPMNYLLVEALERFHHYYGDDFLVECPTGSGTLMTLKQVAGEVSDRLTRLFLKDAEGRRPIHGDREVLQADPAFVDHVWFHEYFHGDTGAGLGASHQTGWTGLVANLLSRRNGQRS
ncbi:glucosidase [Skermanella stibiiresistens SB22]|uniref:Glucosidase n=1 Tax=Skermanella stibiiresistens SB22 TaxID=1385369 RepID=W9H1N1_9PROT|nr:glucosidase [Skermanella stibiiresistens]EWY37638.1 glucosidase [Skermanella stibiiresistens SB22]